MKSVEQLSGEVAEMLEISIPGGLWERVRQTSVRYDIDTEISPWGRGLD